MASRNYLDFQYFSLLIFVFLATINYTRSHDEGEDYILCRLCGADLADAKSIVNHLSPYAFVIVNQTLFQRKGVEVQLLKNPLGIKFQSITLSNSKCAPVHNWQQDFSWYPGYAWKPCICNHCRVHHGWLFEPIETVNLSTKLPSKKGFFVLKLNSLLSENFADSLIVVPKSYRN
ncbi:uncharacterized protein LOC100122846 [Nasonia vitripennis]|uniref:CULT domain-containing protein n=1 Tax=Nasonia vitripennis TaxID=7425 RepID=A0A7M7GMK4_NASVI|nr:uncharacterized protein LOC100122846 [Nasonia vitripennis]XP_031778507.1 uncharacterized protein LOC100122846 [Nasonia vitripennis]